MERLAPRFRVLAPDSYDAGNGPHWPSDRVITLADEVALIEPVLERAGVPLALVGHSYGGAIALIAALKNPKRVRALALYEPTLFSLIDAERPPPNDADGIRKTVERGVERLDAGDLDGAAQAFIDYWMGEGTWAAMPPPRKAPIAKSAANMRRWAHALMREPTPVEAFRTLDMPVLYMTGERSTASALGVARRLAPVFPNVERAEIAGVGHMAPVTHPEEVNVVIESFLARTLAS
jgi:pimeloyl-ACP methyl ester carboxylesterase